jgi:anthranilate synthase
MQNTTFHTTASRVPYCDSLGLYAALRGKGASCLFESASVTDKSSRMSLIGVEPCVEFTGKGEHLVIRQLAPRGGIYVDFLRQQFSDFIEKTDSDTHTFVLHLPKLPFHGPEEDRLERQNIAQPLRQLLAHFKTDEKNFCGLYGALGYRFVYLFEEIEHNKPCNDPDFHLFLFDTVLLYNHLTKDLTLYITRETEAIAKEATQHYLQLIAEAPQNDSLVKAIPHPVYAPPIATPDDETFKRQVARGVQLCNEGELLEIVLSRQLTMPVSGDLLPLYARYRAINPSPYLFYFDFADELLLGASPELMLRYEDGRATLRPISGSVRRSNNPIEDHHLMMELLNSPKENSELDMLIDLGRNDLARICQPGIEIDHYRIIEKYSHVTHTVSQVSGVLEERYTGFDALIASLNAGTLTGAPKVAAMQYIERIEQHTRGYYGGSIGWMLFNGDVNTAITIRTAHIRDGLLKYTSGATLLYESEPENELRETRIKSGAFLKAIGHEA